MKLMKLAILVLAIAVALMVMVPSLSWAADNGAAVYKAKCAMCHGPDGAGKIGPALKGIKMSAEEIATFVQNGKTGMKAPHSKGINGVSAEQAKAVAEYVKSLK